LRPLSVLIVDDEPPARRRVRQLLAACPNASVVAEAGSLREAREQLAKHRPDLALVDIRLRDADAFELFRSSPLSAAVVFVSAHAEHALRAFECDVLDYLLKPVRPERLAAALARAERWRARRSSEAPPADGPYLALQQRQELRLIACGDILHIAARDDHSELFLKNDTSHLDPTRMDDWERRLPATFVRTHRSHIANLGAALALSRRSGAWWLELLEGARVPVSRSRLETVRGAFRARFAARSLPDSVGATTSAALEPAQTSERNSG
jgi:two-component system response regulator AlgR